MGSMDRVLEFLAEEPVLLLSILLAIGTLLGRVRVFGVPVGPAAVLFAALAASAIGAARDVPLELPPLVGTLGLVLFTYTVGLIGGPTFFNSLRTGWRLIAGVVVVLCLAAVTAVVVGRLLDLEDATIAGTFAGALTNTPALAAATEVAGGSGPTVGYSISYLWGVVGMMLAVAWVLTRQPDEVATEPLVHQTIRVDQDQPISLDDLSARYGGEVTFTRLRQRHAASPTQLAEGSDVIRHRDLVTAVGTRQLVDRVTADLGHASSHDIVGDRHELDFRRIVLSNPALAGQTVAALGLDDYGATASRLRRGDVDLVAQPDLVVQMGDRLRVIAPRSRMGDVSRHLGDSERGVSDINPAALALGIGLGILLGLAHIPLPGGGFSIGAAAGTLVVGLVFGRLGRIGPLVTTMSHGASNVLSTLGMIVFLAYAGTTAGGQLVDALTSRLGWKVAVLGVAITSVAAVLLLVTAKLLGSPARQTAGVLGGAQTQPAVLAYADEQTGSDVRVGIGYALVYPAAMIAKILLAQLLAAL